MPASLTSLVVGTAVVRKGVVWVRGRTRGRLEAVPGGKKAGRENDR
ncbi:hypothetical protein [Streptomyces nogalater]|uniref:Uncharacterized protein n=1 Tax=Streptomyces nogalater TaxID=38314 RepID=A0ABW0WTH7_STRNO